MKFIKALFLGLSLLGLTACGNTEPVKYKSVIYCTCEVDSIRCQGCEFTGVDFSIANLKSAQSITCTLISTSNTYNYLNNVHLHYCVTWIIE